MGHTPYGYIIQNGKAIIDKKAAVKIRELFHSYLSGLSLADAAAKAGIKCCHATIANMLANTKYIGDEFYPQIIDKTIFDQVQVERLKRAQQLGKIRETVSRKPVSPKLRFTTAIPDQHYDDPFMQTEYAYSLIKSEVMEDVE